MWAETFAAHMLGVALAGQSTFWEHAEAVRDGGDPAAFARRYVKRHVGRRVELIATYIQRAADGLSVGRRFAEMDTWNIAARAWGVGDNLTDPHSPVRAVRNDAADTMTRAALRVARRGAGRCAEPECYVDDPSLPWYRRKSTKLGRDSPHDYCSSCAREQSQRGRADIEGERVLFDRAIAVVLGGDSRARRRRAA